MKIGDRFYFSADLYTAESLDINISGYAYVTPKENPELHFPVSFCTVVRERPIIEHCPTYLALSKDKG